jgi:predicted hotdog family 3-hydroxylacyl-ACP dehydratase
MTIVLEKAQWQHLIPHRGAMALLDRVLAWHEEEIHATAESHRYPDNPLRSDGRLRALHLCEYGAQAMAVHGGLVARSRGGKAEPGFLVSLRAIRLHVARVDDFVDALDVRAERLIDGDGSWQYQFTIGTAAGVLAEGRAAVMSAKVALL